MQAAVHSQTRPSRCLGHGKGRQCKPCRAGIVRAAATAAAPETGIITRLIGQQLLKVNHRHSIVPLLSSDEHQLPFAAALHIYHPNQEQQHSSDDSAAMQNYVHSKMQPQTPTKSDRGSAYVTGDVSSGTDGSLPLLVELMYVLSGRGHFSSSAGAVQQISAGDSIIAMQQQVTFTAGAPSVAADTLQPSQEAREASPIADSAALPTTRGSSRAADAPALWRNLVPWLQLQDLPYQLPVSDQLKDLSYQRQQQQAQPQHQDEQLVMLQLLLPSELLTGELDHYNTGHCQAVTQNLPWSGKHGMLQPKGCIDEHSVCRFLVGAQQLQQPQPQQQGHLQEQPSQQESVSILQPSVGNHVASSDSSTAHVNTSSQAANGSSSSSSDNPTLPPLSPQQVLKRGLSEVGAFQLPAQTNRLALLFGPHASPAVCLSFGVEVFEPGHVTPLHIHTSAHELFFVLAGKGVGVHGPEGRERVELTAGDVAVFPPGVLHGIDNVSNQQLYCLQMMLPNESFVEWVRSGQAAGALDVGALQRLAAAASCG